MTSYELAQLLDVEHNFAFTARDNSTFCNCYTSAFYAARGIRLPPLKANEQKVFLGTSAEWTKCAIDEAVTRVNAGGDVVACITLIPHGHITPLVESPPEDPMGVYVSAAGARNFVRCKLAASFGPYSPVFYFHQGA